MDLKENEIYTKELKLITSPSIEFYIPSYQRGYRWETTQVKELLDDLYEFIKSGSGKYCLQPVVVKSKSEKVWEVIDGQQRLTTIYIILSRLQKSITSIKPYKIEYETRPSSKSFLENLTTEIDNSNIDFYHISNAYKIVDEWINDKIENHFEIAVENDLFSALMNRVEIIWFQINDTTNPIDVFTRINIGKIPLTPSELIKAIFLSKSNLDVTKDDDSKNDIYQKQLEISGEWDRMEYDLQDRNFWNFINRFNSNTSTRIDFILDLVARAEKKHQDDNYATFRHFYSKIALIKESIILQNLEDKNAIDDDWKTIKESFSTLKEWYSDHVYYHLIGYLIHTGTPITEIHDEYKKSSKSDFAIYLNSQIKKSIKGVKIVELNYGKDNSMIKQVLSLFNIISTLDINDENIRFPFAKLKDANNIWSLEHIHAQNSEGLKKSQYRNWLFDHKLALERLENEKYSGLIDTISAFLKRAEETKDFIDEAKFDSLFKEVVQIFTIENDNETDVHDLGNLALLDKDTNSSLSNSIFEVKRNNILNKEREGKYIPVATRNVFLKYYTSYPAHLNYWTQDDRNAYISKIKETLKSYLN